MGVDEKKLAEGRPVSPCIVRRGQIGNVLERRCGMLWGGGQGLTGLKKGIRKSPSDEDREHTDKGRRLVMGAIAPNRAKGVSPEKERTK